MGKEWWQMTYVLAQARPNLICCKLDGMDTAMPDTTSSTKTAVQNVNMMPTNEKIQLP